MGTPARPMNDNPPIDAGNDRKNLALELNKAGGPLLEQAPESERSEAFSMPVSEIVCSKEFYTLAAPV